MAAKKQRNVHETSGIKLANNHQLRPSLNPNAPKRSPGLKKFKKDAIQVEMDPVSFFNTYILNCRPRLFEGFKQPHILHPRWIKELAEKIDVPFESIRIVGSAQLGYSLSPRKEYRLFSPEYSDIDVAIISEDLFDLSWSVMRSWDFRLLTKENILNKICSDAHFSDIYSLRMLKDECIPLDRNLLDFPYGQKWKKADEEMGFFLGDINSNYYGLSLNFRIYRSNESLRHYQLRGIKKALLGVK